jgi:hypothetical protein
MEESNYIRELVQFAEKGENNESFLTDLYKFSREKWGTNFSTKGKFLDETIQRHIDRNIELEKKEEEKELESIDDANVEFENDNERVKYFLNKAKREKKKKSSNRIIEN